MVATTHDARIQPPPADTSRLTADSLAERIRSGEIDTVIAAFPDVYGRLMGKRFTGPYFLDHVAGQCTHGCNYLLTISIEMDPLSGFELANWEKGFGDFEIRPDLSTLAPLPWQPGTALVVCDLHHHGGPLVQEAPRSVLRGQVERLSALGLTCNIASEPEFFLFNNTYGEAFAGHYANLAPSSDYRIDYHTMQPARDEQILRAIRQHMTAAGIPVESTKGEFGKGQHEVNLTYSEPLPMADRHVLFKQGAREIAAQHGKSITFMPKIFATEAGSSCHIHTSIARDGANQFWDAGAADTNGTHGAHGGPSRFFRQFLGGLLKYSRELCYFFAPTINAYKRYQAGSWAPTKMVWSMDNRTAGFRVVGHGPDFRIENRMPGADANPYLAFAATIAAGLAGVQEDLDSGDAYHGNAYTDAALAALPASLREAADLLEASALARRVFGDAVVDFYVLTARHEVRDFDAAVTDWERVRYFERI